MRNNRKKKITMTRRQFITRSSIVAAGGTLLGNSGALLLKSKSLPSTLSTVVLIRNNKALDYNQKPVQPVVKEMLDQAVTILTGVTDPVQAWKTIIKPSDIVGIKTNVWRYLNTTSQVEQSIKGRVMDVGVPKKNISVSDRRVLKDPVFLKSTALINARPMRTHHWSGVGSLIKNYIMFVPDPYNYHNDSCADLGKIWHLPLIKNKTRLNVLVMFTPQFHNVGPHGFNPSYVWPYYGLIVGYDPVAVDSVGLRILEAQRKIYFKEDRPLNPPAKHIRIANTRWKLGNSNPKNIKIIKIGCTEGILL